MKFNILLFTVLFSAIACAQSFTGSFDLITAQINSNGNVRSDTISYFFTEDKTAIIMHAGGNQPDMRLVFTPADSTIVGLFEMKGKKSGYILNMNDKQWPGMHYALQEYGTGPRIQLNYTGNKKEINGYSCVETTCENEKFDISFWFAENIEISLTQAFAYQTVGSGGEMEPIEMLSKCGVQALSLETLLKGKEGNPTINITVENFSEEIIDTAVFSSKGHKVTDMRKVQ
tara:strand:+ start:81264 stop:81953 length:690 start_codon:yes stop_codon:yes gene_type:complete